MNSAATRLRTKIGKWKANLVDRWPYWWMVKRATEARTRFAAAAATLPPVAAPEGGVGEIHMLCGKNHMDMAIWSSWSFLRFLPHMKLYVHSDGSLDDAHQNEWCRVVPGITFIRKEAAEEKLNQRYPDCFTLLKQWRKQHVYSAKVVDFHLFGDSQSLILLDSDVLCLQKPVELLSALRESSTVCTWNEDEKSFYPTDLSRLRQITGVEVPPRFNSGLVMIRRLKTEDLAFAEDLLASFQENGINILHHWTEQAIIAALSTRHSRSYALASGYSVIRGKTTPKAIVRHYVGTPNIRPRFYLEGVPMLIQQVLSS